MALWPQGFDRVPDEPWTRRPVEELAEGYDTVEEHGWYVNLDPTVEEVAAFAADGDILVDYSGGTGIFTDRLLDAIGDRQVGIVIVDSSPKFLRLALEKLGDDPRVAFRRIAWLDDVGRLEHVDAVLGPLADERIDATVSTNAIHLYHDLDGTLGAWRAVTRPGGKAFVSSGNIRREEVPPDRWIIDETVDAIDQAARAIVRDDDRWSDYRQTLADEGTMATYRELKRRYFPSVRSLSHYLDALRGAGFEIETVDHRPVEARVEEWYDFLSVYSDGVLGWIGGAEKVTGESPDEAAVEDRRTILREAMDRVFGGDGTFTAEWTYVTCRQPS